MVSFELLHRYLNNGDQESGRGWGPINSTALFAIWISILVLFLACPFIGNANRRRLCWRRCFKCDWSSAGQDEVVFPMMVTPRYPVGDPRHRFTKEEAENETKTFITESLAAFTKIVDTNDFNYDYIDDVETGIKNINIVSDEKQSSTSLYTSSTIDTSYSDQQGNDNDDEDKNESPNTIHSSESGHLSDSHHYVTSNNEDSQIENDSPANICTSERRVPTGLQIPAPSMSSESFQNDEPGPIQCVNAECSICLNPYAAGDMVSWSALDCSHAFHQTCIVEWLMTLGKKANNRGGTTVVRQNDLCTFKMVCPICRQDFIPRREVQ